MMTNEDLTNVPEWAWKLLDALADYEDEHSILYRLVDVVDGKEVYEQTACFGAFLGGHGAWPPLDVSLAAEFRRHVLAASKGASA